ncbi:MAG: amidohydrolase family protein [Nevskiales bacterium]
MPPGATDCHLHIFGPYARYPLKPERGYTPPEALVPDYLAMANVLGLQRRVIVQPSVFGTDNACSIDAVDLFGRKTTRVIAVIDDGFDAAKLRAMDARGVRGVRFNAISGGGTPMDQLDRLAARIAEVGWHLQLYINSEELPALADHLLALPVPVVIDHMGQVWTERGLDHPEFRALLRIVAGGGWVKLCGYRVSSAGPPYADLVAPARALIAAAPERCVWGTDWPHPNMVGPLMPDDGVMLDLLASWCTDAAQLQRILVDNPGRLYGF